MPDSVMDWELAIQLAGNSRKNAEEMFVQLAKELPHELVKIKNEYEIFDFAALKRSLHQLHGALCYCGVPRLKHAVSELEHAINHKQFRFLSSLMTQLEFEVNQLINQITSFA